MTQSLGLSQVHDPVNHIAAAVVINGGRCLNAAVIGILKTQVNSLEFFRFEMLVGLVSAHAVVEFGNRRQTQRCVIGGKEFESVTQFHAHVHAGIETHVHTVPRVAYAHHSGAH